MSKYYIVQRIGYQYNDEIYYRSDDDAGSPEKVFIDSDKAEEHADKMNAKELSDCQICQYGYGIDEIVENQDEFIEKLNEIFNLGLSTGGLDDYYDFTLPKMTVAQYKKLKPFLKINFFEVCECDGE